LTLLLGATLAVSACLSTVAHAKEWSTIRFGVDASYPPFESKAPDGTLVGFDIDVGNELCRRLNAK
jgi:lysine/arginine/ornithine transport system substrate-binding protein